MASNNITFWKAVSYKVPAGSAHDADFFKSHDWRMEIREEPYKHMTLVRDFADRDDVTGSLRLVFEQNLYEKDWLCPRYLARTLDTSFLTHAVRLVFLPQTVPEREREIDVLFYALKEELAKDFEWEYSITMKETR